MHELEATDISDIEFVTLEAGGQKFCLEIMHVREIRRWAPATELPHSPDWMLGVINLRGAVIPIVDLSARLGLGKTDPSDRHVIIIVIADDNMTGLLVESVSEICGVSTTDLHETPNIPDEQSMKSIRGVATINEEMSRIIDLAAVLLDRETVAA